MIPANLKFLNSKESITSDIGTLEKFDIELLRKFWRGRLCNTKVCSSSHIRPLTISIVFKTSSNVLPAGHRLENLFWRIWGSDRLLKRLSGSRIAHLFMMIQQGEEAFERENSKLRIPEFGRVAQAWLSIPGGSLKIPPTPPPSPIDSYFHGSGGRPPMSRLPSQDDITESLYQAFLYQQRLPIRASPPDPPRVPPPSPATPMASPLLAAVLARTSQGGYFGGPERPQTVANKREHITNIKSAYSSGIAPPRYPTLPSSQRPTGTSGSTLFVSEQAGSMAHRPTQEKETSDEPQALLVQKKKGQKSCESMAESMTSSTSAKVGRKSGVGNKASAKKSRLLPKGKAKFAPGKKTGLRPSLVRSKSSTGSTVVKQEHEDEEDNEDDEDTTVAAELQAPMQHLPTTMQEQEPKPERRRPIAEANRIEKHVSVTGGTGVVPGGVIEGEEDEDEDEGEEDEEEGDGFEDEKKPVAPPPMRRTISAGPTLGGKKTKKGSSSRLSKKHRNSSANAGRAAPGLGIAAVLGGPGTVKGVKPQKPFPTLSIVDPDFRLKFQERNNLARTAVGDKIALHSRNSSAGSPACGLGASDQASRREKLVFLTSDTEAKTVKCQATVSVATTTSSMVVAKKVQGQNVLVVDTGNVQGFNTPGMPVASGKALNDNRASDINADGSVPSITVGSRKSTLSLMIEDAKKKNGGKLASGGGRMKGNASLGGH